MTIQYDGGRYSGWQRQGNTSSTIQGKLEQALTRLIGQEIELSGSGRTDGGVHALGQVANFRAKAFLDCEQFRAQLNGALPEDIYVSDLRLAGERFHARFSAREKVYRYTIETGAQRNVFARKYVYHLPEALDIGRMQDTAALLLGTHDFRGFSTGRTKKTTVRHLSSIDIRREGANVTLTFTGNGFLYNMARAMAGTVVYAAEGKIAPKDIGAILDSGNRTAAGPTVPAGGLYMTGVWYDKGQDRFSLNNGFR